MKIYITNNHSLMMYLAGRDIMPLKENCGSYYYKISNRLMDKIKAYHCRQCFYRGGRFES